MGMELRRRMEGRAHGRPFPVRRLAFVMDYTNLQVQTPIGIGVLDIRNAAAATIRGVEVESTSRLGRGVEAGGHVTWLDAIYDRYIAVAEQRLHRRRLGQPVEQRAGMGGTSLDRVDRNIGRSATTVDLSRVDGTVHGVLHAVQRQHPEAEPVWPARQSSRIWPSRSSMVGWRVCAKPHQHGLRHGDFRHAAHRIWRTSWTFASVRDRFHRTAVTPPRAPRFTYFFGGLNASFTCWLMSL